MKHKKISFLILLILFIWNGTFSNQTEIAHPYQSLKGLEELLVSIDNFGGDEYGITKEWLRHYIEGRLRGAGIKLLDQNTSNQEGKIGYSFLSVILFVRGASRECAYAEFRLEVSQDVYLARDRSLRVYAATWQSAGPPFRIDDSKAFMEEISGTLDYFLEAYKKQNSKTP